MADPDNFSISEYVKKKAKEKLYDVTALCRELIEAGITKDEIIAEINKINTDAQKKGEQ